MPPHSLNETLIVSNYSATIISDTCSHSRLQCKSSRVLISPLSISLHLLRLEVIHYEHYYIMHWHITHNLTSGTLYNLHQQNKVNLNNFSRKIRPEGHGNDK